MSHYQDYDPQFNQLPNGPFTTVGGTANLLLIVALVGIIVAGAFLFPTLSKQWAEQDLEFRLKEREITARADAEVLYRKKEAEGAADAKIMAERLAKTDIAPSTFRTVFGKVGPAVVSIRSFMMSSEQNPSWRKYGEGSGVIVRVTDGWWLMGAKQVYVLTNCHVVQVPAGDGYVIAPRIAVTLHSGRPFLIQRGESVYADAQMDLAVLRFEVSNVDHLVAAEFAPVDSVAVGDWAMAIGSPFGLSQTVTTGIVSAKGRSVALLDGIEMIQTDTAINPGNSGGPLLDMKGRIIGINTFILSESGGNEGIGFAIPAETAKDVFEQLLKPPHRLIRAYLGIYYGGDLTPEKAEKLHVKGGTIIADVEPRSPAERAGLRSEDIIIKFKDTEIRSFRDFRKLVMASKPGETVTLEIIRLSGREKGLRRLTATLAELRPLEESRRQQQRMPFRR